MHHAPPEASEPGGGGQVLVERHPRVRRDALADPPADRFSPLRLALFPPGAACGLGGWTVAHGRRAEGLAAGGGVGRGWRLGHFGVGVVRVL